MVITIPILNQLHNYKKRTVKKKTTNPHSRALCLLADFTGQRLLMAGQEQVYIFATLICRQLR